jgi:hypothetical protein
MQPNEDIFSNDYKYLPMTIFRYAKKGSKWIKVEEEHELISNYQVGLVLSEEGLPFERSHRRECRNRYRHNHPYDTFSSISPDGQSKTTWFIDFQTGEENYRRKLRELYDKKEI